MRYILKPVIPAFVGIQIIPHQPEKCYNYFPFFEFLILNFEFFGFDFLGYWFSPSGLGVALKTVVRCLEKVSRLYEQGAPVGRIGEYLGRWWQWVRGGVNGVLTKSERKRGCWVSLPLHFLQD